MTGASWGSFHWRSTKAGVETPATRSGSRTKRCRSWTLNEGRGRDPGDTPYRGLRHAARSHRSTKAGVETPATPWDVDTVTDILRSAQRRPGSRPRRHFMGSFSNPSIIHAQRRPGSRPRRHLVPSMEMASPMFAQRRPGSRPRRHRETCRSLWWQPPRSLNEGRGRDPGDTRHPLPSHPAHRSLNEGRGRDPGDTVGLGVGLGVARSAQRRPGSRPRRHNRIEAVDRRHHLRSTKAGVETPATHVPPVHTRHLARRSTKAGVETPATPVASVGMCAPSASAQRRPGSRPRRHIRQRLRQVLDPGRSTKAGVETPATPVPVPRLGGFGRALNEGRGRDPGDTPWAKCGSSSGPSLNEGRGRDPGDTWVARAREGLTGALNEGRGRDPGDTPPTAG